VAWRYSVDNEQAKDRSRFNMEVELARPAIVQRLRKYEDLLRSTQGLFAASQTVERSEFRAYVAALQPERNYPALDALEFISRVPRDGVAAFTNTQRAIGAADF